MADDKLEKLLKQRETINARIRQEQGKVNQRKRKEDTRRKILYGAWLEREIEKRPEFGVQVHKDMNNYLTRPDDRALFELPPVPGTIDNKAAPE